MSDEDVVFNGHSFANEGVAGDLAAIAYCCVFLDLNKGSYLRVVTDSTAVEVYELGESFPSFTSSETHTYSAMVFLQS
jgi:hypothetical protein